MNRFLLFALFLSLFFGFFRLGSTRLFDVDEAVFAQATKEMVHSGDWITPTYNGENRYDKPILFYWMMAVSYKLFGISEFSARVPSVVSAVFLCIALFFFVRHFRDDKGAFWSVIVFVFSLYFFVYARAAVTDMALTLFISLSLFSFFRFITEEGAGAARRDYFIYAFYAFSALAFLTKGLVGILFPFGIAVSFLLIVKDAVSIKKLFNLKGLMVFFLIALPWYSAEFILNGKEFFEQFIIKHHFKRYSGVISGHKGPLYYYLPVILIGLYPWIFYLPSAVRKTLRDRDPLRFFALVWFVFIFLFFTLSTTKLPNYILPAVPAAVILLSSAISEGHRWNRSAELGLAIVSLLGGGALFLAPRYVTRPGIPDLPGLFPLAGIFLCLGLLSLRGFLSGRQIRAGLPVLMAVFFVTVSVGILPAATDYLQGALYRYSLYAKHALSEDKPLVAYRMNNPSILFYSDHRLVNIRNPEELSSFLLNGGRSVAIAKTQDTSTLKEAGFVLLENNGRYALFERK
ncbi:MAG: glycosyltransferase family 39 protein [Nitrospirae bacterium]|nr:glycosyltransferase family 39 protein [Nitrospirota bacterium]